MGPSSMNIFYPRIELRLLPRMLGIAFLGAIVGGLYGILHDQITYSISPEYFTRLKFFQFHYADFGLPPRYFVAEIGFQFRVSLRYCRLFASVNVDINIGYVALVRTKREGNT